VLESRVVQRMASPEEKADSPTQLPEAPTPGRIMKKTGGESDDILSATLDRLTRGIPKQELRLCISEAAQCEEALKKDIQALEKALEGGDDAANENVVDEMLEAPFTPLDRYWTASALLGRLRGSMAPTSLHQIRNPGGLSTKNSINKASSKQDVSKIPSGSKTSVEAQNLLDLMEHPAYTRVETTANILACWKKIFTNRAAIVFKKPVKDEEAPGYSERIQFPMDLSLVRKMIVTRHITCFQQLHLYIGIIAHNCLKYNGRETDYGIVARDFEGVADEIIRQAVLNADANTLATPAIPIPTSIGVGGGGAAGRVLPTASNKNLTANNNGVAGTKLPPSQAPPMVSEDSTKMHTT